MNSKSVLWIILKIVSIRIYPFFLLQFLFFYNSVLQAQWVQTHGPYSGSTNCIAVSGIKILAGTNNGIFLSTDYGSNWKMINNGMTDLYFYSVAIKENILFASTSSGFFRSMNNGQRWDRVFNSNFSTIAFSGDTMFAAAGGRIIYFSTDNGSHWAQINYIFPNDGGINALSIYGTRFFACAARGIYLSTDNGKNWTNIFSANYDFSSVAVSGDNIYAGTYMNGVFLSTNNELNWTSINNGLADTSIMKLIETGGRIFAGTYRAGLFLSTNNGVNWARVNNKLYNYLVTDLIVDSTNIFETTSTGIFLSADAGVNWTLTGLPVVTVTTFTLNGSNIFAGTSNDGVFITSDNGSIWNQINNGLTVPNINALTYNSSNVYAGTNSGLFRSTNNGLNWAHVGSVFDDRIIVLTGNETSVFAGSMYSSVYRSTNNGAFWNSIGPGSCMITALGANGENIFAYAYDMSSHGIISGVYRSTNNGNDWAIVNGLPYNPKCFAFNGSNVFAGIGGTGIYLSTDNGSNWTQINNGLSDKYVNSIVVFDTNVFAGTENGGVYLSTNNGSQWTQVNNGLISIDVQTLAIDGTYLFAGILKGGVWKRPLSELTGITNEETELPKDFNLSQNYPNPFNPNTTINYSLAKAGSVRLIVYNAIGSKVATVVNEYKPVGNYSVQFNKSNLPSGIYFYKLEAGQFSQVKKMILLK
jgi:photosystem II stability/assembly factor-like uncharacterized protein